MSFENYKNPVDEQEIRRINRILDQMGVKTVDPFTLYAQASSQTSASWEAQASKETSMDEIKGCRDCSFEEACTEVYNALKPANTDGYYNYFSWQCLKGYAIYKHARIKRVVKARELEMDSGSGPE